MAGKYTEETCAHGVDDEHQCARCDRHGACGWNDDSDCHCWPEDAYEMPPALTDEELQRLRADLPAAVLSDEDIAKIREAFA